MQAFDYARPETVEEAVSLLQNRNGEARVLAGGTDLIVQLREGRRRATLVVDVKQIPQLNELAYDPKRGLRLGAAVPCCRIYEYEAVATAYPGLLDAVSIVGGIQIQSRASVGGNLCNASPAADTIPPLIVLQATCIIAGPGWIREVPVESFCTGPSQTVLQPGELLVELRLPPPRPRSGARYLRFTPRNEMDIAVVGAGAWVALDEERTAIESARIALGAVAPTPLLVKEAGDALAGRTISEEAIHQAAEIAQAAARPITDMRGTATQRRHLVGVLTRRALRGAIERAKES